MRVGWLPRLCVGTALWFDGFPRYATGRPGMSPRGMLAQMNPVARRGFVASSVMRQGYVTLPGGWAEGFGAGGDQRCESAGGRPCRFYAVDDAYAD